MEHSDDSNSSVGSYSGCGPINYSKQSCQLSSKATAFSIDALIGKRTLAKMQANNINSETSADEGDDVCDSTPAKFSRRSEVHIAPLGVYFSHACLN